MSAMALEFALNVLAELDCIIELLSARLDLSTSQECKCAYSGSRVNFGNLLRNVRGR
jgi:hypothetical protein